MIADGFSDLFEAYFMTVMIPFYPLKKNIMLNREKNNNNNIPSHGNAFEVLLLQRKYIGHPLLFISISFFLELGQSGGITIKINLPLRTSGCACLRLLPVGPHFSPSLKRIHLYQSFTLQNQWQPSLIRAQSLGELGFSRLRIQASTISPYIRQATQRRAIQSAGNGLKSKLNVGQWIIQ